MSNNIYCRERYISNWDQTEFVKVIGMSSLHPANYHVSHQSFSFSWLLQFPFLKFSVRHRQRLTQRLWSHPFPKSADRKLQTNCDFVSLGLIVRNLSENDLYSHKWWPFVYTTIPDIYDYFRTVVEWYSGDDTTLFVTSKEEMVKIINRVEIGKQR